MKRKTTREALENTLLAIDTNIRQLIVTKAVIEDQLAAIDPVETVEPEADPMATMGSAEVVEDCQHGSVQERHTMGTTWYLCNDCKEMVPAEQVDI